MFGNLSNKCHQFVPLNISNEISLESDLYLKFHNCRPKINCHFCSNIILIDRNPVVVFVYSIKLRQLRSQSESGCNINSKTTYCFVTSPVFFVILMVKDPRTSSILVDIDIDGLSLFSHVATVRNQRNVFMLLFI